ncbi:hypothetical protein LCGC14_2451620 [marine sediment metagenome]|uniref:Uncharacterized protein n=1 Tax=marine sediment metagenome TaxID=412755 RepID=A0A0F9C3I1_9ZZZZ
MSDITTSAAERVGYWHVFFLRFFLLRRACFVSICIVLDQLPPSYHPVCLLKGPPMSSAPGDVERKSEQDSGHRTLRQPARAQAPAPILKTISLRIKTLEDDKESLVRITANDRMRIEALEHNRKDHACISANRLSRIEALEDQVKDMRARAHTHKKRS